MKLPESPRKRVGLAVGIAAVVAVYYLVSRLIPHDDLQGLLEDISNTLGDWTYLLVGGFAFLETGAFVGLVVPGETIMLLGGAVAGQNAVDLYLLMGIAWFAAWAGDTTSFFIGRRLGRGFVMRHGPRFGISHERFERVESYFARHGGKTILIGRFISLVRALAPFVAGSSGMRYRAFVPYSILGTGIWSIAHILIGYGFSRSIDTAAKYAGRGFFVLGLTIATIVGLVLAVRWLREAENRRRIVASLERRRLGRALLASGRRIQPQARFVWARLTPGGRFGLEFTTTLAVLSVGLFVLVSYTVVVSGDLGPTAGDMTAGDVVDSLEQGWLTDLAKLVTDLGSAALVFPLAAACAVALAIRRQWSEVVILLVAATIIVVGVDLIKVEVDRPRPDGGVVSTDGSSFPSGHAAYSTFYAWLAVMTAVWVRPGMARASLLVIVAIALAAVVGLSRVYLNVHYLSDVNAGWALGVSAFALCTAVSLVVSQLRQNGPRGAARAAAGEDRS